MALLPRLALATSSNGPEPAPASLAILAGLASHGWRVQHFRSRARPFQTESIGRLTGLPGRHLDAWLMTPETCRAVFVRGTQSADLAIVEGTLDPVGRGFGPFPYERPGQLAPLVEALDLPTVLLLDCQQGDGPFHLPPIPENVDAVVLDGLRRPEDFDSLRRMVRMVLKRPVLGAVEALPRVRAALKQRPADEPPPQDLVDVLSASFRQFADLAAIRALADSRPFSPCPPDAPCLRAPRSRRFRVAYAQDEAFGGYFPDTLETLEALGAELVEFSPLGDESLPPDVDLVMIGCGFPDRFADELAANLSLHTALRQHVCQGHRIYSEGGGTAYLGRSMTIDGRTVPGAGILPLDAVLRSPPHGPSPVTRTLGRDSWLGPKGTVVRGYRSNRWTLRPGAEPDDCPARSGTLTHQRDVYFRRHAIGSLIHLHLAAFPQVVQAFGGTYREPFTLPGLRRL